jgi:hypothetical protein
MTPTREQIRRAAYERWERRGRIHGADQEDWVAAEMDTMFRLNYETVAEFWLDSQRPLMLGQDRARRCRFCEHSQPPASFSATVPVIPRQLVNASLFTRELCDGCAEQFAATIDVELSHFWKSLKPFPAGKAARQPLERPTSIPAAAYKSLIKSSLLVMPESELDRFLGTIEWVCNPNDRLDLAQFEDSLCLLYRSHASQGPAWASLCCRTDDGAPLPYALFFLGAEELVLQVQLPLCTRDQDLDGKAFHTPRRSFSAGTGADLKASDCWRLRLIARRASERQI